MRFGLRKLLVIARTQRTQSEFNASRPKRSDARRPRATKEKGRAVILPFSQIDALWPVSHAKAIWQVTQNRRSAFLPSLCSFITYHIILRTVQCFRLSLEHKTCPSTHPSLHQQPTQETSSHTRPNLYTSWWIKDHLWMHNVRHMPSLWDTWAWQRRFA